MADFGEPIFSYSRAEATVKMWALVGPGDTPAPVFTIMLEGED